ncbi:MAG: TPM domain-containing protein, partial [Terriglobales bacterium]
MGIRLKSWLTATVAAALLLACAGAQSVPTPSQLKPNGFVNDFAHVLDASTAAALEQRAEALNRALKVQVAMVTVTSTGQSDAFDFSYQLAQRWGVGAKTASNGQDKDTGLLIFVAVRDHHYFTQVGYGVEPYITDADVGTWMRGLTPQLRAADFGAVFNQMLDHIESTLAERMPGAAAAAQLAQQPTAGAEPYRRGRESGGAPQWGWLIFVGIIWLVGAFSMRGRGMGGCLW